MTDRAAHIRLLIILTALVLPAGCKDDEKKKAFAEAAEARMELIKAKAEMVKLKGEISYLKDKLQTVTLTRDDLQEQLDQSLKEHDDDATETQNSQQEIDNLKAMLAEQNKKAGELERQVEQLKTIIREFQARIEQKDANQPKPAEQTQTGK